MGGQIFVDLNKIRPAILIYNRGRDPARGSDRFEFIFF